MPAQKTGSLIVLISAMSLLALLALWVVLKPPAFDAGLLNALAGYRAGWADLLFRITTWAGSLFVLLPLVVLAGYGLFQGGLRNDALFMACGLTATVLLTQGLKHLIARPRPGLHDHLADTTSVYAFPSSHVAQITAVALLAYLVIARRRPAWQRRTAVLSAALVIVVAASRLYLQVHYPLDVVAGILTALVAVLACDMFMNRRPG
jgi:undecaprenyl-diphosphatase